MSDIKKVGYTEGGSVVFTRDTAGVPKGAKGRIASKIDPARTRQPLKIEFEDKSSVLVDSCMAIYFLVNVK